MSVRYESYRNAIYRANLFLVVQNPNKFFCIENVVVEIYSTNIWVHLNLLLLPLFTASTATRKSFERS